MTKCMKKIIENAPKVAENFFDLTKKITEYGDENGIDSKTKELILIATFSAIGGGKGIETHVKRAVQAGAIKEEVIASVLYTLPVIGISKVTVALEEILKFFE